MVFSSVIFLFLFLPVVLGVYFLCPKQQAKNLWLIAASLLFYAFSGLWYVLLLLFSVLCNYIAGLFVSGRKPVLFFVFLAFSDRASWSELSGLLSFSERH